MTNDKTVEEIEFKINSFIKKWCGNYSGHLLDTDENDGQELREFVKGKFAQLDTYYRKKFAGMLHNKSSDIYAILVKHMTRDSLGRRILVDDENLIDVVDDIKKVLGEV